MQLRYRILPVLVFSLAAMQLSDPSHVWKTLLIGLGGVWLISYLWARGLVKHVTILREMRYGWIQVGDALEERFTLDNTGWFPVTWAELEDRSTLPGYNASLATGVDGYSTNRWHKNGTCTQRGLYQLGDTTIHSGDPFGVYSVTIHDPAKTSLLVVPPVIPLPALDIAPGGFSGEGRSIPNAMQRTLDASSIREYIPGESLRQVHWKTTARHGKLFVRLFDGAPASNWWILLDLQYIAQAGEGENSTDEFGIILAASLADHGLRLKRGVGLIVNGKDLGWKPPRTSGDQRWEILRTLALASRGTLSLGKVLSGIRPNLGKNASLIIITATPQVDWLEALPPLLRMGISPTILLLDRRTFEPPLDNSRVAGELKNINIACHIVPRDMLDRPGKRPGKQGQWQWHVSALGKAVPVRAPKEHTWRRLAK